MAIGMDSREWAETLALAIIPTLDIINRKCTKEAMPINSSPIIITTRTRTASNSVVALLAVGEAVLRLLVGMLAHLTLRSSKTTLLTLKMPNMAIVAPRKPVLNLLKLVLKDATPNL